MIDVGSLVKKAAEEALRERGHANVLIAGRSGVGKSTLINSIFQGDFATVGHGRPVTTSTREICRDDIPLTIFDTRGLELADFSTTLNSLREFVRDRCREKDSNRHIHVAWVCIAEDLRRVEEAESSLVRVLADYVPVVGVITKCRADNGFRAEVQKLLPETSNVLRVRAIKEVLDDGHTLEQQGLTDLIKHTLELFPNGQRRAFVAAQKADLELKRSKARTVVAGFAASALAMGATPIPMAETIGISGVYIAMFAGVTTTYGLNLSEGFLSTLVASIIGTPTAALSGPLIVGSLLKLIPGAGTLIGGAITGTVAAALATSIGMAYIEVLHRLYEVNAGEPPSAEDVIDQIQERFGLNHNAEQAVPHGTAGRAIF